MEMYKSWGATTTAIDIMELYNALQQKTVDGQENPFLSIASLKLFEVQNYMIVSGHSYLEYIMACSKQWWDGLDDATKALITEVVVDNQQFCYDRLQEYNKEYYDTIAAGDITIYELTPEEKQAFKDASKPVYEKFGQDIGTDLLNRVQEFLADPANQ
jgi:C4-dicarboxylate-binding protein DctP